MTKKSILIWVILVLAVPFFIVGSQISAETSEEQLAAVDSQRSQLQKQLADIESQIKQFEKDLTKLGSQKNTLAKKISQLKIKQAQLSLQIKKTTLQLEDLQITTLQTQSDVDKNQREIILLKDQLGVIIKEFWKLGNYSSLNVLVGSKSLSSYYDRLHNYQVIGQGLNQFLETLNVKEKNLQDDMLALETKTVEQQKYLDIINLQKTQLASNLVDQSDLLSATKGKEANYQTMLKDSKAKAAEIRNRIYSLIEVSQQITFGQAVDIATWAGKQTGVRPAMLLAILTQESNLGKNVGTCNRAGDPPSKSYKVVMKPSRDIQPFLQITKELGRNPDVTPVSCPMKDKKGKQVGYGGAMGPAQFIPSTWIGYRNKITAITGKPADPWDIRDAFLAAAVKLAADGGTTKAGEWTAAMKYFSGGTNLAYRFYGDNVVATADKYQSDIDELNK